MDSFLAIVSKRDQREYADHALPEEVVVVTGIPGFDCGLAAQNMMLCRVGTTV